MFERLKSALNIPPKQTDDDEVESSKPESREFVRAEKPADLQTLELLDKADLNLAEFTLELDAFVDGWSSYASDRNLYTPSEVRALRQAQREAVQLAGKLNPPGGHESMTAKLNSVRDLEAKLEEIRGPRAQAVEAAVAQNEARLAERSEATPAETKRDLRSAVEEVEQVQGAEQGSEDELLLDKEVREGPRNSKDQEQQLRVHSEQLRMDEAEDAYLTAYKQYYSQKGAKEKNEPDELVDLKLAYDESRLAYANALTASAHERLNARGMKSGVEGHNRNFTREDVLARYNRIVRYNQIIKPAAEKRYQARVEAMDSREKGLFMKGLAWFGEQNKKLESKFGKTGSRVVRAVGVTAIAGTAGVLTGALASVGVLGAAGWAGMRIGRALINSSLAAGAGALAGEAAGLVLRRGQRNAVEDLTLVGRTDTALSIDELDLYDRERMLLEKEADERTLQNRKMVARAIGAFATGAGLSAIEGLLGSPTPAETPVENTEPAGKSAPSVAPTPATTPTPEAAPVSPAPEEAQPRQIAVDVSKSPEDTVKHMHPTDESAGAERTPEAAEPRQIAVDVGRGAEMPAASSTATAESTASTTSDTEYKGEFSEVKPLPEGMNPESPEAVAYLDRAYNPQVFDQTEGPSAEAQPAPEDALTETAQEETLQQPIYEPSYEAPTETQPEVAAEPQATPVAESAPSPEPTAATESSVVEGVSINKFGVEVDAREPHFYQVEGIKDGLILYGGDSDAVYNKIQEYYDMPGNENTSIYRVMKDPLNPDSGEVLVRHVQGSSSSGQPPVGITMYESLGKNPKLQKFEGIDMFSSKAF